ncbi:MAG: type I glyceraldehyde-3-phosphate dehydrogenase [Paracoccaceae bacterium]|nr:type I glyceraldehyde-3-phosphate dehydrogenase [Paracoccaceae bacterium]
MTARIGINGFGRIGRAALRAAIEAGRQDVDIVAINDLTPASTCAHLLEFDSVHGRLNAEICSSNDSIVVDGNRIRATAEKNPENLPWKDIDIVLECTGRYTSYSDAERHLKNGSGKVLLSAPGKNVQKTIVYGVNHDSLEATDKIVSNASCTTNCLAPIAQILHESFGIETGYMTTVHAYTGDQRVQDSPHADLCRARAASVSMIPTSTGAARAISLVLPELSGRLDGTAIRVPIPNVSAVDLKVMPTRLADVEAVNAVFQQAAEGRLKGILGVTDRPLVSIDFNHDPRSSVVALDQTSVTEGGLIRVLSWYDNEWGYANRLLDTAVAMTLTHA